MAVLGFLLAVAGTTALGSRAIVSERLVIAYDSTTAVEAFPTTADAAVAAGWNSAVRCRLGQGRFFRQLSGDESDPIIAIYSHDDRLIGINLRSDVEQPSPPWEHFPQPFGITGIEGRNSPHWGLGIYLTRPILACNLQPSNPPD